MSFCTKAELTHVKGTGIKSKLPYYVNYSDQELAGIMSAIGMLDNDERIIFTQICHYSQFNNNATIDLEDLTLEIVKWAERHNYAALRLTQTARRIAGLLLEDLQRAHFCILKVDGGEISGFTLLEPEFEQITARYKRMMDQDITLPFPMEKDLIIPPMPDMVIEIPEADLNTAIIDQTITQDKIGKIVFNDVDNHVLVTPKVFTQLPNLCLRKIYKYLKTPGNLKIVDFIIKSLEVIMPDKSFDSDKVMKILSLEEKAGPEFFVHFTENLIRKLENEKNVADIQPVFHAAIILKQFKLEQMKHVIDEEKEQDKKEDIHRLLNIMQKNHRALTRQELYQLRDDPASLRSFSGTYEKTEFNEMVDTFLEDYTKASKGEGSGDLPIPPVFRIFDAGNELYIHREYLVPLLERERGQASAHLKKHYQEKWRKALKTFSDLPEMKRDKSFEENVQVLLRKHYPIIDSILRDYNSLFNLFVDSKSDADIYSRMPYYFQKPNKPLLKKYFEILDLNRNEIYQEAYSTLPFLNRFFLTRLILYIINMFAGKKAAEEEKTEEETQNETEETAGTEDESARRKEARNKMRRFLTDIERNYRTGGNITEILDNLNEKWNNKIGEVRLVLREKVDRDVHDKSMAIYRLMLKSPNFSEDWLHRELRNMANTLSTQKYTEVQDKKSLAMYIIIVSIWTLRNKVR